MQMLDVPALDQPFSTTPSPRYFYLAEQYREALNHAISTVMQRDGLGILAGPIGCGKSTLLRYLVDWLNDALLDRMQLGIIYNPSVSTDFQLLKAICKEFDLPPKPRKDEQLEALREHLAAQEQAGKVVVLLIDEAHKLNGPQLELVREFFNFAHNDRFYMQVILAGETQPLKHKLKNKQAILSRAMYYYDLEPLTLADTRELIRFRLKVAELPTDWFTDGAIATVHHVTKGVPRSIVKLCRHAYDLAKPGEAIDVDQVEHVARKGKAVFGG